MKIGDKVNAIDCVEAGMPDVCNMEVVSVPWKLGHGEEVVRVKRPSGKVEIRATAMLVRVDHKSEYP